MNDHKLIELVKNYPILYDSSRPNYMDSSLKNGLWWEIGKEMKQDWSLCRSRWNIIRDTYKKSLRKSPLKTGKDARNHKEYKYSKQLGFLQAYLGDKDFLGNNSYEGNKANVNSANRNEELLTTDNVKTEMIEEIHNQPNHMIPNKSSNRKIEAITEDNAASKLIEYLLQTREDASLPTTHPIDPFLAGIGATLKTFSPHYLNLAKTDIFSVVQRYELKMLNKDSEGIPTALVSEAPNYSVPSVEDSR